MDQSAANIGLSQPSPLLLSRSSNSEPHLQSPHHAAVDKRAAADLQEALIKDQLVIFIGSGVVLNSVRGNQQLLDRLTWIGIMRDGLDFVVDKRPEVAAQVMPQYQVLKSNPSDSALTPVAQTIKNFLHHSRDYRKWLDDLFGSLNKKGAITHPQLLRTLDALRLKGAILVTTNYDHVLENNASQHLETLDQSIHDLGKVSRLFDRKLGAVYHVHGEYTRPDDVVFDDISYEKVNSFTPSRVRLESMLIDRKILFLGCGQGLDDPHLSKLFIWMDTHFGNIIDKRHYLLKHSWDRTQPVRNVKALLAAEKCINVLEYGEDLNVHLNEYLRKLFSLPPEFYVDPHHGEPRTAIDEVWDPRPSEGASPTRQGKSGSADIAGASAIDVDAIIHAVVDPNYSEPASKTQMILKLREIILSYVSESAGRNEASSRAQSAQRIVDGALEHHLVKLTNARKTDLERALYRSKRLSSSTPPESRAPHAPESAAVNRWPDEWPYQFVKSLNEEPASFVFEILRLLRRPLQGTTFTMKVLSHLVGHTDLASTLEKWENFLDFVGAFQLYYKNPVVVEHDALALCVHSHLRKIRAAVPSGHSVWISKDVHMKSLALMFLNEICSNHTSPDGSQLSVDQTAVCELEIIDLIVENHQDSTLRTQENLLAHQHMITGVTPIYTAVCNGKLPLLKLLFSREKYKQIVLDNINKPVSSGWTAMTAAIRRIGDNSKQFDDRYIEEVLFMIECLAKSGKAAVTFEHASHTPLGLAVQLGGSQSLSQLEQAMLSNARWKRLVGGSDGVEASIEILRNFDAQRRAVVFLLVSRLLQIGERPDIIAKDGVIPLHEAIRKCDLELVKLLLDHNADVNRPDHAASGRGGGDTPLFLAANAGEEAIVKLLLAHPKIELELMNDTFKTPGARCRENGHHAIAALIEKEIEKRRQTAVLPHGHGSPVTVPVSPNNTGDSSQIRSRI